MSKESRGKKGESLVKKKIGTIKEYHRLLNDITFINEKSEMTHQIDHILIHPHGIFVIETKNYYGEINCNTHDSFWLKNVKGKIEKISNPLKQNKLHVTMVKRAIKNQFEVVPVVVFAKNNAPYMGDENLINLKDLTLFIKTYPYQTKLEKKNIDSVYKTLKSQASDVSKEEHLENIGYLKQIRKEIQDEIAYAIESGTCPRCDHKMIVNGYNYRCSNCDFKFKL